MVFPRFAKAYKQGKQRPIEGYISFVAQHSSGRIIQPGELQVKSPSQADICLGQACIELSQGNVLTAGNMLREIQQSVEPAARTKAQRATKIGRQALQTLTTVKMVRNHADEGVVGPLRREMHTNIVDNIKRLRGTMTDESLGLDSGTMGTLSGEFVEQTALGILTRYAHPRALAMPALHFQDQGRNRKGNYDMVLVETFEGQTDPEQSITQKIQTKSDCINICGLNTPPKKTLQSQYDNDITLLSGCCDLGMRGSLQNPSRYAVPSMLIREAAGQATPEDIVTLDELTNRALFNLTIGDERRMGQLPVDSFAMA